MSRTQLVVICLALLPACGPSHALLKQGREAAAAQDYESAYLSYNAVLQQKPTHGEALAGRRIAQEQVLAAADDEVTRLLAAGRLDAVAGVIEASSAVDPPADWVSARLERCEHFSASRSINECHSASSLNMRDFVLA